MKIKSLLLLCCAFIATGCATIITGPSWLTVETDPSNIKIQIEAIQLKKTFTRSPRLKWN